MNRNLVILVIVLAVILFVWQAGIKVLPSLNKPQDLLPKIEQNLKVVNEESVVIDVVKRVGPSVITVGAEATSPRKQSMRMGPFGIFFGDEDLPKDEEQAEDFIGSGFIVKKEGLVVTNKHVVSNASLKYIIVDSKGNKYNVGNIYRDPLNDVAILKISNPPVGGFQAVEFGDSDKLQVGQAAIAIGTALGEFRNTVTTGVISGLGRGISAGSPFQGFVEQLDNVIQTDAAINPGNSGGPLLNAAGQVIGVNTAVASQGQNIGFAIPINVVKRSIDNFNQTGQFNRAFLGVSYVIINRRAAVLNDLPEGALVREVVDGSPAQKAGVTADDIITKIDGEKITDENNLALIINKKKVGQEVTLTVFRDDKTIELEATLQAVPSQ